MALQGLLAAAGGLPTPYNTGAGITAFELCLNGAQQAPGSPSGPRDDLCHVHCALIAGSQHWLDVPPPSQPERIDAAIGAVARLPGSQDLRSPDDHQVAQPRAPPRQA